MRQQSGDAALSNLMSQLSLFGQDQEQLDLAPVPDEVAALSKRLPPALRLGTMSWTYPGWSGALYAARSPPKQLVRRGLTAYSRHPLLRAVEIDRTFYGPISAATFSEFAAQVPDDFRFAAKAHEHLTRFNLDGRRNPRLLDAAYAADQVVAPFVEGLGQKAGPLIFQFPRFEVRSPAQFASRLHDFLRRLPKGPIYAVEIRNSELLTRAYGAALADAGAVHCHNAWTSMPGVLEQRELLPEAARRVLVVRWLTRPGDTHEAARQRYHPFDRLADEDLLRRAQLAQLCVEALRGDAQAFVFISNKAEGCAPESVLRFANAVGAQTSRPAATQPP